MRDVIALINSISKDKLPSKFTYVLKTSQLENLLADNNISIHTDLSYSFYVQARVILCAHYYLPNNLFPYCRLYIIAGALPKEDVFLAREELQKVVFPEFTNWISNILALPDNSTSLKHGLRFDADFHSNKVFINRI